VTPDESNERNERLRRTRSVRRGVVAAGATGALGAALAIGTTIHASGTTAPGATGDQGTEQGTEQAPDQPSDQGGFDQAPPSGQLAAPGGNGPAQGRSGGS
jgi:hypothetical protein